MFNRTYSLRKSRQILEAGYASHRKYATSLDPALLANFENDLEQLQKAIASKDKERANTYSRKIETFSKEHFKKSAFSYAYELVFALLIALCIATIVRQTWFELYEIPTGSMRPTFKEQDHLTVSKLAFGINTPLETSHLYFDPKLVQRTSVIILSGDKIPIIDQDTTFFLDSPL